MESTTVNISVPDIPYRFKAGSYDYSRPDVKKDNVDMLKSIKSNDYSLLSKYGSLFGIPPVFTAGFIAVESGGKGVIARDGLSAGKLQISPNPFYETFNRRLKSGDIAAAQQALVRQAVPGMIFDADGIKTPAASLYNVLMRAFINNNEFGIYAGCLYMKFLIDRFSINGVAQINKVIVAYNAGHNKNILVTNIAIALDSANLASNSFVPMVSRAYLVKMLGIDGYLDLCINQKLVNF